jgi:uncharacterized membrane protein YbhN (UPF0104 family)
MKQVVQLIAGGVLAAALLAWVLHDKDPEALGAAVAQASIAGLALGAALNFGHNVLRVWRWGLLLAPVRRAVPFRPMFTAVVVGYLTTWLVPGRLGELVRPLLLSGREGLPFGPCLGTVVADRILDGVAIVVLFAAGLALAPLQGAAAVHAAGIRTTATTVAIVLACGLGGLLVASANAARLTSWIAGLPGPLRWIGNVATGLARGVDALRDPKLFLVIAAQSVAAWIMIAAGTWVGIRASGADVPFSAALVLLPLLALGVALPTPGGAGGYHLAMAWGLTTLFAVAPETAAGAGILMHLAVVIPVLIVGPLLLRADGIAWKDLISAARQARGIGASPAQAGVGGAS